MAELAHARGAVILVDGAQAAPHLAVDVKALDVDFYVLSAHKIYGPSGVGVLYGRQALLEAMPPWQGGGDMILSVTFEKTTYNELPYKFEAGAPHQAGGSGSRAPLPPTPPLLPPPLPPPPHPPSSPPQPPHTAPPC